MTEIMSLGDRPKQEGEVMNSNVHNSGVSRARVRAYAVCSDDSQTIRQTRVLKEPILARPRARTRGPQLLAKFKAWRIKTFGGDFDPVAVAVDEAVAAFSTKQPDDDRALWLKIANRIGVGAFRELMSFQISRTSECQGGRRPKPLRNPASAFQNLLNAYDEDVRNGAAVVEGAALFGGVPTSSEMRGLVLTEAFAMYRLLIDQRNFPGGLRGYSLYLLKKEGVFKNMISRQYEKANVTEGGSFGAGRKWKLEEVKLSDLQMTELDALYRDMTDFMVKGCGK